jgi:acyl transferase domain-containing protein
LNGDGRSYSFDARGEGYGRGEGIGIVILKRLADALRDGDAIRAVIRNTGVGQDGKTAGITLPSAAAQASLIESVYARASLDPHDTAYVEAHGTGTVAGDYAELGTISKLFGGNGSGVQKSVHVGSIKANIGHTESTSGVAGLIKAALVVEKGIIPPNPPIEELKPKMLPEKSAVVVRALPISRCERF